MNEKTPHKKGKSRCEDSGIKTTLLDIACYIYIALSIGLINQMMIMV